MAVQAELYKLFNEDDFPRTVSLFQKWNGLELGNHNGPIPVHFTIVALRMTTCVI